jgi:hypothetical protein
MKSVTANVLAAIAMLLASPLAAQNLQAVYVSSEEQTAEMSQCNLTYTAAIAAAEAAFRYNRIVIAGKDEFFRDQALNFYINLNAFEIKRSGGLQTGSCTVSMSVSLQTYTMARDPVSNETTWVTLQYCSNGTLAVLDKLILQQRINETVQQYVNQCASEYSKAKRG